MTHSHALTHHKGLELQGALAISLPKVVKRKANKEKVWNLILGADCQVSSTPSSSEETLPQGKANP